MSTKLTPDQMDLFLGDIYSAVVKAMHLTALDARTLLIDKTPRFEGDARLRWIVIPKKNGATVSNDCRYIGVLELGRRPGVKPPFVPLARWAREKKIQPRVFVNKKGRPLSYKEAFELMVNTMRSTIASRGIKGKYIMNSSFDTIDEIFKYHRDMLLERRGYHGF